jgi:hypothetical protein
MDNRSPGGSYSYSHKGKMCDGGCLHVGTQRAVHRAHTRGRCSGAGACEAGSGQRQHEGDAELRDLSLTLVQEGEVKRCRAEEATRQRCVWQRWHRVHAHALHAKAEAARGTTAVWLRRGAACLIRTLVSERDAAQRRPRGGVVPSGSGASGPRARGGAAWRHGGARTASGRRCRAASLVG